jgi:hypothetical protein
MVGVVRMRVNSKCAHQVRPPPNFTDKHLAGAIALGDWSSEDSRTKEAEAAETVIFAARPERVYILP